MNTRNQKTARLIGGLLMGAVVASAAAEPAPESAAQAAKALPKMQVTKVLTDSTQPSKFYIIGRNFDVASQLQVSMGWIGNITNRCSPPNTNNPSVHFISCDFAPDMPEAGDYRLFLRAGKQKAQFDFTFGPVGPQGPAGPPGPSGQARIYLKSKTVDTADGSTNNVWKVACDGAGDSVIGGGYWSETNRYVNVYENAPSGDRHSWYVSVSSATDFLGNVTSEALHIYAYCTSEKLAG